MKFVDYYETLGVKRDATQDEIRKAYRRLAHKYHPDVSADADTEEKFKDISVAYATLKDPEKRAAYDQLGTHTQGEEFVPPRQWRDHFSTGSDGYSDTDFSDIDLSDLLAAFAAAQRAEGGGHRRAAHPIPGQDFDTTLPVTLEQIFSGADTQITLTLPERDAHGLPRQKSRTFQVHIPKGASDGQRLRLAGQGGPGFNGGKSGDLYLTIQIKPHSLFRVSGKDLYMDLPLAPWEAALGTTVEIPTLGGPVEMTIPPMTETGRKLRLKGRGLPGAGSAQGNLYAVVTITIPKKIGEKERELYKQLADLSTFRPRAAFDKGK